MGINPFDQKLVGLKESHFRRLLSVEWIERKTNDNRLEYFYFNFHWLDMQVLFLCVTQWMEGIHVVGSGVWSRSFMFYDHRQICEVWSSKQLITWPTGDRRINYRLMAFEVKRQETGYWCFPVAGVYYLSQLGLNYQFLFCPYRETYFPWGCSNFVPRCCQLRFMMLRITKSWVEEK